LDELSSGRNAVWRENDPRSKKSSFFIYFPLDIAMHGSAMDDGNLEMRLQDTSKFHSKHQ
jgi:hypothetical protein